MLLLQKNRFVFTVVCSQLAFQEIFTIEPEFFAAPGDDKDKSGLICHGVNF